MVGIGGLCLVFIVIPIGLFGSVGFMFILYIDVSCNLEERKKNNVVVGSYLSVACRHISKTTEDLVVFSLSDFLIGPPSGMHKRIKEE